MLPLLALQVALVMAGVMVMADGCVTVNELVLVQLLASVTVTVYVPAARPVRGSVPVPTPLQA